MEGTIIFQIGLMGHTIHRKYGDKTFIWYSLYEEGDEPKLYYIEGYDL